MKRPGRRDFLALLASGIAFRPEVASGAEEFPIRFREPSQCADLRPFVDPSADKFRLETRGMEIEETLRSRFLGGHLPLAAGFRGESPMPARYVPSDQYLQAEFEDVGESFSKGLQRWFAALGRIRRARFSALPGDIVVFEITSSGGSRFEHRVGRWRMRWEGRRLAEFEPISETLVRSSDTKPNSTNDFG